MTFFRSLFLPPALLSVLPLGLFYLSLSLISLPLMAQEAQVATGAATGAATGVAPEQAASEPLPGMDQIEQAWAAGDFVFVRAGLKRHAEETGTPLAQYRYGRVLLEGRGGPQDMQGAQFWLEKAAAQTHAEASVLLARIYLSTPTGSPERNPAHAAQLFKSAAARGNSEAQYYLGLLYGNGTGVDADPQEAFTWLLAAAENGHVEGQFELSRAYARGVGVAENSAAALRWMEEAASAGHLEAQFYLAYALDRGQGVAQNRGAGLNWLRRSAEGGFVQSELALGRKYLSGDGVDPNPQEALRWLGAAAEAGNVGALASLGRAYLGDMGIAADLPRAQTLLRQASEAGHAEASYDLAGLFAGMMGPGQSAQGVVDLQQALVLYQRAAEQGSDAAVLKLGHMAGAGQLQGVLAPHRAVPWALAAANAGNRGALDWLRARAQDGIRPAQTALGLWMLGMPEAEGAAPQQAAKLLLAAAEAGDTEAQHQLGRLYIQGTGVEQDYVQAHKWLNIAAAGGSSAALELRTVAADLMVPEQIAEAQAQARAFFDAVRPGAQVSPQVVQE